MAGRNWNSKTKEWTELVKSETKEKAKKAQQLKASGKSVEAIANMMGLSESRIREYLRNK